LRATRESWPGTILCMSATEVLDMSAARVNVLHMSKMIQIRNVPDEMHKALKTRAASEGMTLSDYIKRELSYVAGKSEIEEIGQRVRARGPSGLKTETIVRLIREGRDD
jgi:plasmid stability protein